MKPLSIRQDFQINLGRGLPARNQLSTAQQNGLKLLGSSSIIIVLYSIFFNLVQNNTILVTLNITFLVAIAIATYHYYRDLPQVFPPIVFTVILASILLYSMHSYGVRTSYWLFPMIVGHAILAHWSISIPLNLALTIISTALLSQHTSIGSLIGFFVASLMMLLMSYGILAIILNLQQRLSSQSLIDPLTGLNNRRFMSDLIAEAIYNHQIDETQYGLVLLDIDFFKSINDKHGHKVGDDVLIDLAKLLSGFEEVDKTYAMRIGGEEFLLLVEDCDANELIQLADNIRTTIANAPLIVNRSITASFGTAMLDSEYNESKWLQLVDMCLYQAKYQGRNCIVDSSEIEHRMIDGNSTLTTTTFRSVARTTLH